MSNRVTSLIVEILNCFIFVLLPEIRREFIILHPYSISRAIGLAKLVENKLQDARPKSYRATVSSSAYTSINLAL